MNLSAAVDLGTVIVYDKDLRVRFSVSGIDLVCLVEVELQLFQVGIYNGKDVIAATWLIL